MSISGVLISLHSQIRKGQSLPNHEWDLRPMAHNLPFNCGHLSLPIKTEQIPRENSFDGCVIFP